MLSTFHDDRFIEKQRCSRLADGGVEIITKPTVVEYKLHMGGVDKGDEIKRFDLIMKLLVELFASADLLCFSTTHKRVAL